MAKIIVVEDEANLRLAIQRTLARAGHVVQEAQDVDAARRLIAERNYDIVITDVLLGDGRPTGLELVRELRTKGFEGVIIVMTAYSSVDNAVAAMKDGADDYLQKPLSLEELSIQTARWLERRNLSTRLEIYERSDAAKSAMRPMLGQSETWRQTLQLADKLAASWAASPPSDDIDHALPSVLILGETGAGKGVLARYIHENACTQSQHTKPATTSMPRSSRRPPFVHVHCSAIPTTSLDAELFGSEHNNNANNSTHHDTIPEHRAGLLEMADGGTIFLDEVADLPHELQSKLLDAVDSGVFRRVGSTRPRRVIVRVIASSNRDLEQLAEIGDFRRDLLYRLNALTIRVPPLRERDEDAALIASHVLTTSRRGSKMRFSPKTIESIQRYNWPGNIRELVNAINRAVLLCDDHTIEPLHLGLDANHNQSPPTPHQPTARQPSPDAAELSFDFKNGIHTFEDVERSLIMQALQHTAGNVSGAAKLIGMQRSSLRYRIERYNLESYVAEVTRR